VGAPGDDGENGVQLDSAEVRRWLADVTARPLGVGRIDTLATLRRW
jgi:hypothetical protein